VLAISKLRQQRFDGFHGLLDRRKARSRPTLGMRPTGRASRRRCLALLQRIRGSQ
jgi:hypothetical protein